MLMNLAYLWALVALKKASYIIVSWKNNHVHFVCFCFWLSVLLGCCSQDFPGLKMTIGFLKVILARLAWGPRSISHPALEMSCSQSMKVETTKPTPNKEEIQFSAIEFTLWFAFRRSTRVWCTFCSWNTSQNHAVAPRDPHQSWHKKPKRPQTQQNHQHKQKHLKTTKPYRLYRYTNTTKTQWPLNTCHPFSLLLALFPQGAKSVWSPRPCRSSMLSRIPSWDTSRMLGRSGGSGLGEARGRGCFGHFFLGERNEKEDGQKIQNVWSRCKSLIEDGLKSVHFPDMDHVSPLFW